MIRSTRYRRHGILVATAILAILTGSVRLAAKNDATNLERFQKCARIAGDSLVVRSGLISPVCVRVVDHPAGWLVEQGAVDAASDRSIEVNSCTPPYVNDILIAVTDLGVRYLALSDEEFLRREVRLGVSASIPRRNGESSESRSSRATESVQLVLRDTIEAVRVSELESPAYPFTVGNRIERTSKSFWDTIAEPAVVVGTSVVMIVLLFTTRSQ